jgi:hypothetical protein
MLRYFVTIRSTITITYPLLFTCEQINLRKHIFLPFCIYVRSMENLNQLNNFLIDNVSNNNQLGYISLHNATYGDIEFTTVNI